MKMDNFKYSIIIIISIGLFYYLYRTNDSSNDIKVSNLHRTDKKLHLDDPSDYGMKTAVDPENLNVEKGNNKIKDTALEDVMEIGKYWSGEWKGVDEWKRRVDVIRLEKQNGAFILLEDRNEPKIYNYDSERNVFVWKMDYYGKELKHIIKFFNRDKLLRNSWSGKKDFPELYKRTE